MKMKIIIAAMLVSAFAFTLSASARTIRSATCRWGRSTWTNPGDFCPNIVPGAEDTLDQSQNGDMGINLAKATDPSLNRLIITNNGYDVASVIGGSLKFCGTSELIFWPNDETRSLEFENPIIGEGENTLLINMNGGYIYSDATYEPRAEQRLYLNGAMSGFSWVRQLGGRTYFTNSTDKVGVDGGDYKLNCGILDLKNAGTHTLDKLTLEGSMNYLYVHSGETLTIGSLDSLYGATLRIVPDGGAAALGDTVKIFIGDRAAGSVDGRLVFRADNGANTITQFLKYDTTLGLIPLAESDFETYDETSDKTLYGVISNDSTLVISKNITAKGIVLTGVGSTLTVNSGATLTLDGGSEPGFVYLFDPSTPGVLVSKTINIDGAGTIAAGNNTAMFWLDIARDDTWQGRKWTYFKTKVTGTQGVSFAGYPCDATSTAYYSGVRTYNSMFGYTGATRITGTTLRTENTPNDMPEEAYVESAGARNAYVVSSSGISNKVRTKFHFSGGGVNNAGVLYQLGWGNSNYGKMELNGHVRIGRDNIGNVLVYNDEISGPGSIYLSNFRTEFRADNTFTGDLIIPNELRSGTNTVSEYITALGEGNFGAGNTVLICHNGYPQRCLCYTNTTAIFRGNLISSGWPFAPGFTSAMTKYPKATFLKRAEFSAISLPREMKLVSGGELVFGGYTNDTDIAFFGATNECGRLVANNKDELTLVPGFLDSAECPLNFEMRGAGTVTLAAAGYRGETRVSAGTVKFMPTDMFHSPYLAYHLDAHENVTINADGKVIAWGSCGSDGIVFTNAASWTSASKLPGLTETNVCGTKLIRFDGTKFTRLIANNYITHRTIFMVLRIDPDNSSMDNAGYLGSKGADFGLRATIPSKIRNEPGSSVHFNLEALRKDGAVASTVNKVADLNDGKFHIIVARRDTDEDVKARFIPVLGQYQNWADNDGLKGEFAEVLAYKSALSDYEIKAVEKLLSQKWNIELSDAEAELDEPSFTGGGAMDIADGATLDLGGRYCEISDFYGYGTLTNSSATPATLVVSRTNLFAGTVTGPITVKIAGAEGGETSRAKYRNGAALALANGVEFAMAPRWSGTITNGVVLHVDASAAGAVEYDSETLVVTNWNRFAGEGVADLVRPGSSVADYPPKYAATGLNGMPAVHFDHYGDSTSARQKGAGMRSSANLKVRTIFVVGAADATKSGSLYLFGLEGYDLGCRSDKYIVNGSSVDLARRGSLVRMYTAANGWRDYSIRTDEPTIPTSPFILALDVPDWHQYLSSYTAGDRRFFVGGYFNGTFNAYYSEFIVYDRLLSEREIENVSTYLVNKWFSGSTVKATEAAFDATSGNLGVSGGATLKGDLAIPAGNQFTVDVKGASSVTPFTIDGNLTIGAGATLTYLNYLNLPFKYEGTSISATGTVTGDFELTPVASRYSSKRVDDEWKISHPGLGGVLLFW